MPNVTRTFTIPNFLGGVDYSKDPTQLACNQFWDMNSMTSEQIPETNQGCYSSASQLKGLAIRGTLRKLGTSLPTAEVFTPLAMEDIVLYAENDLACISERKLFLAGIGNQQGAGLTTGQRGAVGFIVPDCPFPDQEIKLGMVFPGIKAINASDVVNYNPPVVNVTHLGSLNFFTYWRPQKDYTLGEITVNHFFPDRYVTNLSTWAGSTTAIGAITAIQNKATITFARAITGVVAGSNPYDENFINYGTNSLATIFNSGGMYGNQTYTGWDMVVHVTTQAASYLQVISGAFLETAILASTGGQQWRLFPYKTFLQDAGATTFTNITALIGHKQRAIIATWASNQAYLQISDAGNPTSIQASNIFAMPLSNSKVLKMLDIGDSLLLYGERGIYQFFLDPISPVNSSINLIDEWRLPVSPQWITKTPHGPVWLTQNDGLYLWNGLAQPICPQLRPLLRQVKTYDLDNGLRKGSLAWSQGRLNIGLPWFDAQGLFVFTYDMDTNILEKKVGITAQTDVLASTVTATCQVLLSGSPIMAGKLKIAVENDPNLIYEADYQAGTAANYGIETALTGYVYSKKFALGGGKYRGQLKKLEIEWHAAEATNAISVVPYLDDVNKSTVTVMATTAGFNRSIYDFGPGYDGYYCQLYLQTTRNLMTNGSRTNILYRAQMEYEVDARFGSN